MTPYLARKWIARLKVSKKAKGILARGEKPSEKTPMCCLGHLAHMQGDMVPVGEMCTFNKVYANDDLLRASLLNKYGISREEQQDLADINDAEVGFAKVIEKIRDLYLRG